MRRLASLLAVLIADLLAEMALAAGPSEQARAPGRVAQSLRALAGCDAAERGRVLTWLSRARQRAPRAGEVEQLCANTTGARDFYARLVSLRSCLAFAPEGRGIADHLLLEHCVNALQAARRLDRCARALLDGETPTLRDVRAELPRLRGPFDPARVPLFPRRGEMVHGARDEVAGGAASGTASTWEDQLDGAIGSFSGLENGLTVADWVVLGDALLLRDRTPEDPARAHVVLAMAHARTCDMVGRARAAAAAALAGREDDARRLSETAQAGRPISPAVHLWCALTAAADRGGADRFLAHLHALADAHHDPAGWTALLGVAPILSVTERGADVALSMVSWAGSPAPVPLRAAWTSAVEIDAAPLAALELALWATLPRARVLGLLDRDPAAARAELEGLSLAGERRETSWLTTSVVGR